MTVADRRESRLARYARLHDERPSLFHNPPGAAYEILFDRADQEAVAEESAVWLRERGLPEEYGDIGVVYEDSYVILVRDAVRYRTGERGAYIRFFGADLGTNAAVLPLVSDGRVALVRHFRHGTRKWHWEIPRGFAHDGADGAATAKAELTEEIGVHVDEVRLLGRVHNESEPDEIYVAEMDAAVAEFESTPETAEGIDQIHLVTMEEFTRMVAEREITDVYALAAYAFATATGLVKP